VMCVVGMRASRSGTEQDGGNLGEVCSWNEGF
jgi:hypothetical protein